MKFRGLFSIIVLASVGIANANVASTAATPLRSKRALAPTGKDKAKTASVRGGAGPLKKLDVAKLATILSMTNAALITLAPGKTLDMYGLNRTPLTEYLTEWIGHLSTGQAITAWSLYFGGSSIYKAVGAGIMYLSIYSIKSLLNEVPKKLGFSAAGQLLYLAINVISGHALLTGKSYASAVMKAYPAWSAVNALAFCLAPDKIGSKWGVSVDTQGSYEIKQLGFVLATKAVYYYSLATGVETTTALGYGMVPSLVGMIVTNFISKEISTFGMSSTMQYFWLFLKTFFAAALSL